MFSEGFPDSWDPKKEKSEIEFPGFGSLGEDLHRVVPTIHGRCSKKILIFQ
jgi:hypothetical protein